jgi:hypothetical protein
MQTPHRFRTKRQLWTYSGLGLETRDSAQYRVGEGQLQRSKKPITMSGLLFQKRMALSQKGYGTTGKRKRTCASRAGTK